ncbi:hypothetical protein N0V82_004427 [Gnomoniopsis sp. IMI 355080]|nr:hypothetical protein N0V82_004427 [Gnomoniopsis sp. IMI 355080]
MKASIFVSNGVFLLGATQSAICAIVPAVNENWVSSEEHLDQTTSSMMTTVAAEFEAKKMDTSFVDPGGHVKATTGPNIYYQALHSSDDYSHPRGTVNPNSMMVKCNDQNLQSTCGNPPFNIRCTEGCASSTMCAIIMDHPHMLCESECTCIAGDKDTMPTFNEFADLE